MKVLAPFAVTVPLLLVAACQPSAPPSDTEPLSEAEQIVEAAIDAHGGDAYRQADITFDFREYRYRVVLDGGQYRYERTFEDSVGTIRDVLTNEGLARAVNGTPVSLSPDDSARIMTPLNSVPYFVLLPYRLRDPAVQLDYRGTTTIEGEPYDQVEVTFREAGGGEDFEDVYMYWFHRDRHTMDYLAYTFEEGDGTDSRFRRARDIRTVGGIRFADYDNLSADWSVIDGDLTRYPVLYEQGALDDVSDIDTENVEVRVVEGDAS